MNPPIRAYYQGHQLPAGAPAGSTLIDVSPSRWTGYVEHPVGDNPEVPPLPPDGTNSNPGTDQFGNPLNGSEPSRAPGSTPGTMYTHHLVRDFMFLDAAAANREANGSIQVTPQIAQQFSVGFLPATDLTNDDPALGQFTRGTGHQQLQNKYLLDDSTVNDATFNFFFDADQSSTGILFTILLYQLTDLSGNAIDGNQYSPNWFAVAVPQGVTDFTNVIIYFHASGGQAGYNDNTNSKDYASKSNGGDQSHTNWKEILGYIDRLGSQLAGAIKYFSATPNQIVIVPIMRNANVDGPQPDHPVPVPYGPGVLKEQWYYIVNAILQDIPTRLASV